MAREARIEFPGALYHVMSRVIERRGISCGNSDQLKHLPILHEASIKVGGEPGRGATFRVSFPAA